MGEKRVSIRTLDDGTTVRHFPPDDANPEGRMDLVRGPSPLREALVAVQDDSKARHQELKAAHDQRIAAKRKAQADKKLPPEKSPI